MEKANVRREVNKPSTDKHNHKAPDSFIDSDEYVDPLVLDYCSIRRVKELPNNKNN